MSTRSHNTQMFALSQPPPGVVTVNGDDYKLLRVFKHDFFAATCLYEAAGRAEPAKIVVKFARDQDFCGLPLAWLGEWTRRHEEAIYKALAGVAGVPRWLGRLPKGGYAIEYIEGRPLDHHPPPPQGFFDALRELFQAVHARGVAYVDANKRSNILIGADGTAHLVDYQLALRRGDALPWPIRPIVRAVFEYLCRKDIYHLCKHKRRMAPQELTPEEDALSRRRGGLHRLHRRLTKTYRTLRRRFLRKQHQTGRLISPTAELEDHDQPEKRMWRDDQATQRHSHRP